MMNQPLAERLRPKTLDDYIGQKHLVGQGAVLRKMIDAGRVPSFILWGPPGVGKTTLAQIISNKLEAPFYKRQKVIAFSIRYLLFCLLMKYIVSANPSKIPC